MAAKVPDTEALEGAVAQVRRLIAHLRKTKASKATLARVERDVAALCEELAPHDHPGPYAQAALDVAVVVENGGPPLHLKPAEFFPYSPIIGPRNPIAAPIRFDVVPLDGGKKEIRAEHVFDAPYNGPPGSVHGGIIALVFDELLGCIGAVSDVGGFTGTLTITYRSLTPIGKPIRMRSWIEGTEGVKTFIKGTMHCDTPAPDTLCAEATGIFIRPKRSMVKEALARTGNG
ncbi:PaaI family thioesterase [Myxococcota bacterium]|nr:PaaI family thioesterase [Myxococcota bacterium]